MVVVLIALSLLVFLNSGVSSQAVPNIQVPILTKTVLLDGQMTDSTEWSDTSANEFSLVHAGPGEAPVTSTNARIWAKHDGKWLYFLARVDWPKSLGLDSEDQFSVFYYWSRDGKSPWEYRDQTTQITAGTGDYWRNLTIGSSGEQYRDTDVGGQKNVEGRAAYDGEHYWFEFRKPLNSGDGRDWAFVAGKTYGVEGVDGALVFEFASYVLSRYTPFDTTHVTLSICPCAPLATTGAQAWPCTLLQAA